jgi:integrase
MEFSVIRNSRGLPKHCSWNIDRHGKRRVRFRKEGFSTYLAGVPYSDDFMRGYYAALDGQKRSQHVGAERTSPGSVNSIIVAYYMSPHFRSLRPSTQSVRRRILERFRQEHGEKPLRLLERAHLSAIIGAKAETPEAANNLLKVVRLLLGFAVDVGMINHNPAAGLKKFKSRGDGFHCWTEDEIAAFEARHPEGTKARLALALLLFTAQRRSDVVKLGRQHLRGDLISLRQEKTDAPLLILMHPKLQAALAAVSRENLTFLLTAHGAPFTAAGFGNWFRDRCNEAGLPQCSAHGLRKAAARRLAEAGCSADQIKAVTGHRSLSEVARYTKAADQERLARAAMNMQIGAEQEQEMSNPSTRLDKTRAN